MLKHSNIGIKTVKLAVSKYIGKCHFRYIEYYASKFGGLRDPSLVEASKK